MKTALKCLHTALAVSFLLVLVAGCAASGGSAQKTAPSFGAAGQQGLLSLFLNLKESNGPALTMTIASIEVLSGNGVWVSVAAAPLEIKAGEIRGGQKFLARAALPTGTYSRLRFTLAGAFIAKGAGKRLGLALKEPQVVMVLHQPLYVSGGDSKSLFLTWDTRASLHDNVFRPVILVAPRLKNMIADVAYVACPDINTVFMFRTDRNRVCDSMGIRGGPTYLFKDPRQQSDTVYALTGRRTEINIISPAANKVVEQYGLPMSSEASFMALSPDGRWGYIVDQQQGDVVRMDMSTGRVADRVHLGYQPSYIIYLKKYNLLAVSLSLSQTVVLLDAETLSRTAAISTGPRPEGLWDSGGKWLYIAESGSNSVLFYDLENNEIVKRILVGFSPRRIISNNYSIYVTNYDSSSISVLRPGQLGPSWTIPLPGRPLEIADAPNNKWIYVGNEQGNCITVVDPGSSRVVGKIELGAKPMGIVVLR
ncbi:MAG: hypothetical protein GXP57_05075 [Deltaproteobacteria bacterium]|nr:hypothetical protein [Deltaproteobacteria bacterium]